jgi:hypothetical protein
MQTTYQANALSNFLTLFNVNGVSELTGLFFIFPGQPFFLHSFTVVFAAPGLVSSVSVPLVDLTT